MNPETVYENYHSGREWSDIEAHLGLLRESAKGFVFEIGVRDGISTAALLMGVRDHFGHVWSVDIIDCSKLFDDPQWTFIQGHSVTDAGRILKHLKQLPSEFDLLFIDGDHTYETTSAELRIYGPLVKKDGGVIFMHDTNFLGVQAALVEYAAKITRQPVYHPGSNGMGELRP